MKTIALLVSFLLLSNAGIAQEKKETGTPGSATTIAAAGALGYNHDLALVKPLINTNDSIGGYYSEYWYSSFMFMYCGATIKNIGNLNATHVFMEMKAYDMMGVYLQSYYSDTLSMVIPGETVTVNLPGEINFQPWIANGRIDHLLFIARSDSVDDNPLNDQQTVPFTTFFSYDWTMVSRSVNPGMSGEIGPAGGFHPGDFVGFTFKPGSSGHRVYNMKIYLEAPWPETLQLTAMLFVNGRLLDTAAFVLPSPPESGWIYSNSSFFSGIMPDSSYYVGVGFKGPAGTVFNLGADTAGYHHFSTETVARQSGNWTSLSFVPAMELVCDPEGIPEKEKINPVVYPNPAATTLSIDHVRNAKIELYDMNGKLLQEDRQISPSRKLNISGLPPGIYLLRITGNSFCICKKCVVR